MNKVVEDPKVGESEQQTPAREISVPQSSKPVLDVTSTTHAPLVDQACDDTLNPGAPSPVKTADAQNDDVVITKTGFKELGRPTALAKHSAKEEHFEQRKVRFYVANYSQVSIGEIYSGFLSQVYSSRELEVDMVKQMHQNLRYELLRS